MRREPARRVGALLVAVAAAALLVAPPAHAQRTVTITGGGWGHGIGMSQYGAYGRALRGATARGILEHYYSGASVRTEAMPARIRVGLIQYRDSVSVTSRPGDAGDGTITFKVAGSPQKIAMGSAGVRWKVEPSPTGGANLYRDGEQVKVDGATVFGDPEHPLVLVFEKHGSIVDVAEKPYDYALGRLEFGVYPTDQCGAGYCLRLVASLSMQKYLYGLGEVPSSWPAAALRAQAIAGRTYAYDKTVRAGQHRYPCDCAVFDSTYDQAYIGDAKRTGSGEYWDEWKAAVDDTKDEVVIYEGAPVQALYSSSSGGYTENNENVWGGTPLPYLRGVPDRADDVEANPNHTWEVQMDYATFQSKLDAAYDTGELKSFELVEPFGVSGRVTVVTAQDGGGARIDGTNQSVRVSGWSLRSALGLKDTLFRVDLGFEVGPVFARKYDRLGGAPGDPAGPSYAVPRGASRPRGRAQDFDVGRMTWRKATGEAVWQWGAVLGAYDRLGREGSGLGMPVSDVWGPQEFRAAHYVNGMIVWSADEGGAHTVRGDFAGVYRRVGGPNGPMGLPLGGRESSDTLPDGGRRQRFQDGAVYRNPTNDEAYALWGQILARYVEMGEASSQCGYPMASMTVEGSSATATFEHGKIKWTESAGIEVDCN